MAIVIGMAITASFMLGYIWRWWTVQQDAKRGQM